MPVYNEEASIEQVIADHVEALTAQRAALGDWEIICLDDASTDSTPAILKRIAARVDKLKVIRHQENRGIFESFARVFEAAQGTHVYATAADGQWPAKNLARMLRSIAAGFDLVVGVRLNRREAYGLKRRIVSRAFNLLPRLLFGTKTIDAGSIKLGVRQVFQLDLISHSPFVEAERIIKARRNGYRIDFVPIEFKKRRSGKETGARWSNVIASARDCVRCVKTYGIGARQPARCAPNAPKAVTGAE